MNLFWVSGSNCSMGRILLAVRIDHRAIVVAAGEQGDLTTELAQDDFSYSVNRLGRGAAKARVSLSDQWTVAVLAFALLRQFLIVRAEATAALRFSINFLTDSLDTSPQKFSISALARIATSIAITAIGVPS
jgi:hypothetical protein